MDGSTQEQREQQVAQLKAQQLLEAVRSALLNGRYVVVDCFEGPFTSFITTRFGGNSVAPFDTLNMAYHVGDNPLAVAYNRQLVRNDFGFDHLCFMDQSHTNKVMVVDENNVEQEVFPCDGIVTKLKGVALAVMTADCLPLLLCDEEKQVVGAIHCGWRGIASGIIANAIDKMEELGARRDRIIAYMGPAIGPRSFVVGDDVRDVFIQQYEPFAEAFVDRVVVNPNFTMTASPVASSAFSIEGTTAVLLGRLARTLNAQSSMAKAAAVVAAEKASKEAAKEAAQGNSASHGSSTTFDASYKGSAVAINANSQHPAVDDLKANVAQSGALEQGDDLQRHPGADRSKSLGNHKRAASDIDQRLCGDIFPSDFPGQGERFSYRLPNRPGTLCRSRGFPGSTTPGQILFQQGRCRQSPFP